MKHYDFVIAGGGLAGLSLACRLADSPLADRSLLIVDNDDQPCSDRMFSFWTNRPTQFDDAVCRRWQYMQVAGRTGVHRLALNPYSYQTIRGGDLHRCARRQLDGPGTEFRCARVAHVEDGEGVATVHLDGGVVTAGWVFDSIAARTAGARLKLTFAGWEIETDYPAFDPETVTFMDFRTPQQGDLRFFYVLPFTANHALIEYTAFTAARVVGSEARAALECYLASVLGVHDYDILAQEGSCLPITDEPYPRRLGRRVMAVGIKGGRLKPTTGYAFTRVQEDSAAIVASLLACGHPFAVPPDEQSFRWLDSVMLRVMARHGGDMHAMMASLFEKNPVGRVLSFLDEQATPLEILQIMASLPPAKFIEAALRNHQ